MSSGSAVCRCIGRRIFFKTCFQVLLLHTAQYAGRTESICHFTKNTSLALLLIIGWNDSRFIMGARWCGSPINITQQHTVVRMLKISAIFKIFRPLATQNPSLKLGAHQVEVMLAIFFNIWATMIRVVFRFSNS